MWEEVTRKETTANQSGKTKNWEVNTQNKRYDDDGDQDGGHLIQYNRLYLTYCDILTMPLLLYTTGI